MIVFQFISVTLENELVLIDLFNQKCVFKIIALHTFGVVYQTFYLKCYKIKLCWIWK